MQNRYRQDSARLSAILDATVDGIIVIDRRGIMLEYNHAAERIFGFSREEALGQNVSMLMPDPDRSRHDGYVDRYIETKSPRIIGIGREVTGRRKDGSTFPLDLAVNEITLENELNFVGICRDITERVESSRQLEESRKQLSVWWENAPIAKAVCDLTGRIIRVNEAAVDFWSIDRHRLVGSTIDQLTHPEDTQQCLLAIRELAEARRERRTLQIRFRKSRDEWSIGQVHCTSVRNENDVPVEIMLQIVDRTAEVSAEEEAGEHRERLAHVTRIGTMAEMATGIAHEVNQPLTAIATYSQACRRLMQDDRIEREDILDALEQINAQALRAGEVIRRLRSFVRKRESDRQLVSLNDVIREIVTLANTDSNLIEFEIELDLASDLPRTKVDPVQIQQVVLNLIQNGKDAMRDTASADDTIGVRTRRNAAGQLEVSVRDCGTGISEVDASTLFDPFFTTKKSGMGMGLSISRSIITAHGGTLWFERNPDKGLTFYFTLPATIGDEE
ncbi:MAG: PAS domain S-box protein [Candidatus Eisenbacteria bacterium]|uniref:Sensor protein FixL n=1 Tax=Eiseniibacteriota bacterium TaxID=2212470 RepID=A0A956NBC5_UNCEI|nr:PAS domain S-box protein [Candidatus Eisenbacteria bacterium]MCB9464705.1 PAS domain S-box protein [Candidatus Eisenbacteria bacterium]